MRDLLSSRSVPEIWWVPAISNVIRIRECVVRVAVESKIDFANAFLHRTDERRKIAEAIFVSFATFDACHRQNSVIENEPNMGGVSRCWTGQDLPD
jgi:hypothetical protein